MCLILQTDCIEVKVIVLEFQKYFKFCVHCNYAERKNYEKIRNLNI